MDILSVISKHSKRSRLSKISRSTSVMVKPKVQVDTDDLSGTKSFISYKSRKVVDPDPKQKKNNLFEPVLHNS